MLSFIFHFCFLSYLSRTKTRLFLKESSPSISMFIYFFHFFHRFHYPTFLLKMKNQGNQYFSVYLFTLSGWKISGCLNSFKLFGEKYIFFSKLLVIKHFLFPLTALPSQQQNINPTIYRTKCLRVLKPQNTAINEFGPARKRQLRILWL